MKDYNKDIDNFDYSKKYVPREHLFDFLKDEKEAKKFESGDHEKRTYEVGVGAFETADKLIVPIKRAIEQSSPEITGQYEANPPESKKIMDQS